MFPKSFNYPPPNRTKMEIFNQFTQEKTHLKKTELQVIQSIYSYLDFKKIKKKELILKSGQVFNKIVYVKKGLLRVYVVKDGKEVNTWFVDEDDLFISMNSFYKSIPTQENIQALEDTEIITIDKNKYELLLKENHELCLFVIDELYQKLCDYQDQCISLRLMNAEKKYEFLKENRPEIMEKLSQKHIASFLGVETTYLSKIVSNHK